MSVRHSLLAILTQGACYGSQLRAEFDRRAGVGRSLNAGQISTTLDRLERDGLVLRGSADDGRAVFSLTESGHAEVSRWLFAPVDPPSGRDELATKLALAVTLPGVDVRSIVRVQLEATMAEVAGLEGDLAIAAPPATAEELGARLVAEARLARARGELDWLELADERLAAVGVSPLPLIRDAPRRGRPPKAHDSAA